MTVEGGGEGGGVVTLVKVEVVIGRVDAMAGTADAFKAVAKVVPQPRLWTRPTLRLWSTPWVTTGRGRGRRQGCG